MNELVSIVCIKNSSQAHRYALWGPAFLCLQWFQLETKITSAMIRRRKGENWVCMCMCVNVQKIRGVVTKGEGRCSLQPLSRVWFFVTLQTSTRQASLSITNSWISLKLMSIEPMMPSSHLILCRPLLLLPSIFPSTRVFSNESALLIKCPKYWNFSFSISPFNDGWIQNYPRDNWR